MDNFSLKREKQKKKTERERVRKDHNRQELNSIKQNIKKNSANIATLE